jgi:hypothetical protein
MKINTHDNEKRSHGIHTGLLSYTFNLILGSLRIYHKSHLSLSYNSWCMAGVHTLRAKPLLHISVNVPSRLDPAE